MKKVGLCSLHCVLPRSYTVAAKQHGAVSEVLCSMGWDGGVLYPPIRMSR